MNKMKEAFLILPDTVIITDNYLHILDFNRAEPFAGLKKGRKLTEWMPDFHGACEDVYSIAARTYRRTVTAVYERGAHLGYILYLADVTDKTELVQENRQKGDELEMLTRKQRAANAELAEYVQQAEAVSDYHEQLRIARNIHDDAGHAIAAVHTVSQMCLQLKDSDRDQFHSLLREGIIICERSRKAREQRQFSSLLGLLEAFRAESPFPIELSVAGREPAFVPRLYRTIYAVCKEVLSNTLSHSLADRLRIWAAMSEEQLTLSIFDNGSFHGVLEKGFGLVTLEENVNKSGGTVSFHAVAGEGFGVVAEWREKA